MIKTKRDFILVVEDETNNRYLLKTYLTTDGHEVKMARSGEEALEMVAEDPPSVIVLDILLPNMNGYGP